LTVTRGVHIIRIGMDSRTIIRKLEAAGWELVRVKGSHHQFRHPAHPNRVTVQHPRKDVPIGTLKSIEKQSGLRLRGSRS
jgi:predicted RNA binding protein YcfA (HicA-like mRNA interferase family)